MTFFDRTDAGRQLGAVLRAHPPMDPIVIGLYRGGVPVAAEVAKLLAAPLDMLVVRKLVAGTPPQTFGAVADGAMFLDPQKVGRLALSSKEMAPIVQRESAQVRRLGELLRDAPELDIRGRDAIVVDDALVSGTTIRAAALALRARHPRTLTLALPVADMDALESVRGDFDRTVCLYEEPVMVAAGSRYRSFWPVSEAEVANLISGAHRVQPAL